MSPKPLLFLLGSWTVAFFFTWVAGRRLLRTARGRPSRLAWVAAVLAALALLPLLVVLSFRPALARVDLEFAAALLFLISFFLEVRLVRPVVRFRGDRSDMPRCTDPGVVETVTSASQRLGIAPPVILQWNSLTGSLVAFAGVFGLQAPTMVVTDGVLHRLNAPERDAILVHELAHLRRRSLWLYAMFAPLAAFAGLLVAYVGELWVSLPAMTATYVLLRTWTGRWDELACDRLAGLVIGAATVAGALDKIHVAHRVPEGSRLSTLAYAIATHPHRSIRLAALRDGAGSTERASIPDESEAAARHRRNAIIARVIQGAVYVGAVALARSEPVVATIGFLLLTVAPTTLILAAAWKRGRNARRLNRFPGVPGNGLVRAGFGVLVASFLMIQFPKLSGESAGVILGTELLAVVVIVAGILVARPVRLRRAAVGSAFQSGDFAGVRDLAAKPPNRARRDPAVRHTSAFAAAILGDSPLAIEEFLAIRQEHPRTPGPALCAASLLVLQAPARAFAIAGELSDELPRDASTHLVAARALRRLGRSSDARERMTRARVFEPDDGRLAAFEACLALDAGGVEEARTLVTEAERLAPGDVWPALARAEIAVRTEAPDAADAVLAAEKSAAAHPVALLEDEIAELKCRLKPAGGPQT